MSAFSLANLFGGQPPRQAPAQQQPQQQQPVQTQPGNIPADAAVTTQSAQSPQTDPNGVIPNTPETKAAADMDQFKDMWNVTPNPDGGPAPLFNISQDKMMEAARKQNFTAGVTPEALAKVAAGGAEGVQAMMEIINSSTQAAYAQSAFATTKLIEGALEKGGYAKSTDIDNKVKSLSLNDSLRSENKLFTNPAVTPMLEMVQSQLMTKYPTATPAELKTMAMTYLTGFAGAITAPAQQAELQQQKANAPQGEDWTKYFSN